MNENPIIIDVEPVAHSSSRYGSRDANASYGSNASRASSARSNSYGSNASSAPRGYSAPGGAYAAYSARSSASNASSPFGGFGRTQLHPAAAEAAGSMLGGLAQMAAGAGLVLLGLPMLILPGPGLLAICAGLALGAHGARKAFG